MPTPKKKLDINQLAKSILDQATGDAPKKLHGEQLTGRQANSRKGGLRGGKGRMDAMSTQEKKELALKAAQVRWSKKTPTEVGVSKVN